MPAELQSELVQVAPPQSTSFELEAAHNNLYSLVLMNYSERLSGLDPFITNTAAAISPERRHNNMLVMEGLHFAVVPVKSWNSFEAYLTDLTNTDPFVLRDRLFSRLSCSKPGELGKNGKPQPLIDPQRLIDKETYINFLLDRFGADEIDVPLEREANDYFADPARMHALIIYHLQTMWREFLQPEWNRVRPMLEEAVTAFRTHDFGRATPAEIARRVTGQELNPHLEGFIQHARNLILIPSAHVGPYLGKFIYEDRIWLLFGAHLPEGMRAESSALTRSELLVRLSALNDDTRLRILELLGQRDELCAQDVITLLDLSQPAASRHLKQLSATGYVRERRREGNKCYSLNRERLDETCRMMDRFLSK
jgi:ArsR family transcriptional regulator